MMGCMLCTFLYPNRSSLRRISQVTPIPIDPGREPGLASGKAGSDDEGLHPRTPNLEMTPSINPMQIDLILEAFFEVCPTKTLQNCRLVSHQWRDLSLRAWRDKAVLNLNRYDFSSKRSGFSCKKYLQMLTTDKEDEGRPFLHLRKHPFQNLRIPSDYVECLNTKVTTTTPISGIARKVILHGEELDAIKLGQFLLKFNSLETLELNNGDVYCPRGRLSNLTELSNSQFPKLRRLKIFLKTDVRHRNSINPWKILKCMPNLESLSIWSRTDIEESVAGIQRILQEVKEIRESAGGHIIALKELEIVDLPKRRYYRPDRNIVINTIAKCDFPLKRLTIDVEWNGKELAICNLLNSCKDTLQYLKTSFHFHFHAENLTSNSHFDEDEKLVTSSNLKPFARMNVRMGQLREVCLVNGFPWGLYLLAHLELPNLEKLRVEYDNSRRKIMHLHIQLSFHKGRIYEKLETFEFLDNHKTHGPTTIRTFTQIMPNLVSLTIPLDKTTFQIVCKHLRGLKTLHVLAAQRPYAELDDGTLTGIPMGKEVVESRPPNITDLALLTDFKITSASLLQGGDAKFTDHSVIHGFLQLPWLFTLSLAIKDLSEDVKTKLLSHVKGTVEFQEKVNPSPEYYEVEINNEYEQNSTEERLLRACESEVDESLGSDHDHDDNGREYDEDIHSGDSDDGNNFYDSESSDDDHPVFHVDGSVGSISSWENDSDWEAIEAMLAGR